MFLFFNCYGSRGIGNVGGSTGGQLLLASMTHDGFDGTFSAQKLFAECVSFVSTCEHDS